MKFLDPKKAEKLKNNSGTCVKEHPVSNSFLIETGFLCNINMFKCINTVYNLY